MALGARPQTCDRRRAHVPRPGGRPAHRHRPSRAGDAPPRRLRRPTAPRMDAAGVRTGAADGALGPSTGAPTGADRRDARARPLEVFGGRRAPRSTPAARVRGSRSSGAPCRATSSTARSSSEATSAGGRPGVALPRLDGPGRSMACRPMRTASSTSTVRPRRRRGGRLRRGRHDQRPDQAGRPRGPTGRRRGHRDRVRRRRGGLAGALHPVLRALLLTGETPRWLRAEGDASEIVSGDAPWWPPHKVATRYLAPYLGGEGGSRRRGRSVIATGRG